MSRRTAIIAGHEGQDGRLLTQLLRSRGDDVLGIGRSRVDAWGTFPAIPECRIDQPEAVLSLIDRTRPDEIYYLAARHTSSQSCLPPDLYLDYRAGIAVNVAGLLHFLEAMRLHSPQTRLFLASSSLIYGSNPIESPQDESTRATPEEPYGLCKALAGQVCKDYRSRYDLFASVGILFNHESLLRPPQFLSMKLVHGAVAASRHPVAPIVVGDLDAAVDWGYAPDFVNAFSRILACEQPGDFVVATGVTHTVREFAAAAFGRVGLDWTKHVVQDSSVLTRSRSGRVGDASKLRRLTSWRPSVTFAEMVATLVDQAADAIPLAGP